MFKSVRIKSLFLFVGILGSLTLSAQSQDVSDTELAQFADAYIKVQMQNQEAQKEMMTIIEGEGLEVERFSEIQQSSMDPNQKSDATAEEMKKHGSAIAKIEQLQPELEKKAVKEIESSGITIERFESLASVIQQDQGLQQRLQTILMERQQN
jgi:hypothetical protein